MITMPWYRQIYDYCQVEISFIGSLMEMEFIPILIKANMFLMSPFSELGEAFR